MSVLSVPLLLLLFRMHFHVAGSVCVLGRQAVDDERSHEGAHLGRALGVEGDGGHDGERQHHADDPFRGLPVIEALPELSPLVGRSQVRDPELDPILDDGAPVAW